MKKKVCSVFNCDNLSWVSNSGKSSSKYCQQCLKKRKKIKRWAVRKLGEITPNNISSFNSGYSKHQS